MYLYCLERVNSPDEMGMTYFCHVEKLSLWFSIHNCALFVCVYVCVFFCLESEDGIALGLWRCCHLAV